MSEVRNSIFSKIFWITLLFKQNRYHKYGVLMHTLKVAWAAFKDKQYRFIIPALLHDIAKPTVAYEKEPYNNTKQYSFTDHEELGYQIIKNWPFLSSWTKNIVRYHYLIIDIEKSKRKGNIQRHERLKKAWETLDEEFIKELHTFHKYDEYGKK